jgi:GH25 family lysozyme M1 (1,4-beta-N-acetylmuramidase)
MRHGMRNHVLAAHATLALAVVSVVAIGCGGGPGGARIGSTASAVTEKCGESANGPVQGVDVSVYQGSFDWPAAHVQFGYARISDGTGYVDPTFDSNWANMKSAGVLRGAYQFFEPSEDETAQANLMVSKVGRAQAGDLPPMIDVEVTDGVGGSTIGAKVLHWLQIVEAGTGRHPIIYTGSYFWEDNVGTNLASYPIWIAAYGPSCPSLPADGWSNWTMWQYSDGGGSLDHDVFNGSLAQLQAMAGVGGVTSSVVEFAFQANTGDLWTAGNAGTQDWHLGMMAETNPSLAALATGGFEVAFQANTTDLWTVGNAGNRDWHLGMMPGTSPSITALPGGGFEVAFQANTGDLWTAGDAGTQDWHLGMMTGTSPSIAALPGGGFEVAFQANTGDLWTAGSAGTQDWRLGMMAGTSPAITALPGGGFEVAFEANTTDLWTVGNAGNSDWHLGMMTGSSPSIAALPSGGFEVAFEANTTDLWTVGSAGNTDWHLGMMKGTSPTIMALETGGFQVGFEANTTDLWTVGNAGNTDWHLGMMAGTSPGG